MGQKKRQGLQLTLQSKQRFLSLLVIVLFFSLSVILYGVTLKGVSGTPNISTIKGHLDQATWPFELSPERGRYAHVVSLVENRTYALTKELADVVYPDVGVESGKYYSFFAPGVSFLAVPFYIAGSFFNASQLFTFAVVPFFSIGSMIFLYKIGRGIFSLPQWAAILSSFIFAFASTSWSYAVTLYQHHITTFLILSAFYTVWKFKKQPSFLKGFYIWLAYAFAILVDYPNAILMSPVIIYFFLTSFHMEKFERKLSFSINKLFIISIVGFILLTLFHANHNYTHFGDWKKVSGSIKSVKQVQFEEEQKKKKQPIQASLTKEVQPTNFFKEENLPRGIAILFVMPDKGLFVFSPIFLLSIFGIFYALKKQSIELGILLSLICANIFLYASFGDPWGGWAFGPRYLIISMAILAIFISVFLHTVKRNIFKVLAFFLICFSTAVSLLGVITTNAVPPKIEADFLGMKYGFFLNYSFLRDEKSSSFLYNDFFSRFLTLKDFYSILLALLVGTIVIILFVLPKIKTYED